MLDGAQTPNGHRLPKIFSGLQKGPGQARPLQHTKAILNPAIKSEKICIPVPIVNGSRQQYCCPVDERDQGKGSFAKDIRKIVKSSDSPSQNGQSRDRLSRRTDIEFLAHDFEVAFGCEPRDAQEGTPFRLWSYRLQSIRGIGPAASLE
jgi:hypothetical protein